MRRVLPLLGALALACGGCVTLWRVVRPPDGGWRCAGELVSTTAIPEGFHLRAQVRVLAAPDVNWGLTLATQKVDGRLVVVGLDGFGAKLFAIVQDGTEVDVDRVVGRRMPWPPENVLRDLHRARLGAAEGEGVSIQRAPGDVGRARIVIDNATCGSETILVLVEDGPLRGEESRLRNGE
jgi:Protein of unknown function (DUF3261)